MKKLILVDLLISLFSVSFSVNAYNEDFYCDFSSTQKIVDEKFLQDFVGNQFLLYELENGYAIYAIKDGQEIFVEGSYKTNSIYSYIKDDFELFYLGPGEYFYQEQNMVHNIRTGVTYERSLLNTSFELNEVALESDLQAPRNSNYASEVDENGFTVIKEAKYFKNLSNFPKNWFGECGLIALSMILSYLDTFHNDGFIPNGKTYNARYYVDKDSIDEDGDEVYDSVNIYIEELTNKVVYPYVEGASYGLELWPNSTVPGTNYAMRDYLMDNYIHTFGYWDKPGTNDLKKNSPSPMADEELKKTLNDYMSENCPFLSNYITIRSGNLFFTHQHPKNYIKSGVPTVLILADYTQQTRGILEANWHDVVAYGYKDNQFLVHMGWWPGFKSYAEVVISSATIYGYFAVEYTGEHSHSQNVLMYNGNDVYSICGCGYKHKHEYEYIKANDTQHLCQCFCGDNHYETHQWKFITQRALINPTGKYCEKCGVMIKL